MNLLSIGAFTNVGHRLAARSFAPLDVSMAGRTAVVTGATAGLGREAATRLAELGARVVIVGRNPEKTARVRDEVADATDGEVVYEIADLSSMAEVADLAERLLTAEPTINVLVNNAGSLFPERQVTEEGRERTFATNLLGHYLLTERLIPRLVESAPARIVNVSSGGMYSQRIVVHNLDFERGTYTGTAAYANTKRGQVILTELWAEELEGTGVVVNSMHPGWAKTPGVAASLPTFSRFMGPLLRTPAEGADTIVWLAAAPEAGEITGRFFLDRKPQDTHLLDRTRETDDERRELRRRLEELASPW
jgi:NAD(P)-dependent dehydrogenase (short-subunit alcohol dehydrogenase family)